MEELRLCRRWVADAARALARGHENAALRLEESWQLEQRQRAEVLRLREELRRMRAGCANDNASSRVATVLPLRRG